MLFCSSLFLPACTDREPIKVGFVGGLTGRHSDLGVSGRNGARIAVDEINAKGGVRGRNIQLIIKDDRQDPDTARKAVQELIGENAVAIIGHMTSSMSKETLPIANKEGIVMISPSSSSSFFEGKDDNFIMLYPSTRIGATLMSRFISENFGLKRMAVIYDLSNKAYTVSWYDDFRSFFEKDKGKIVFSRTFTSGKIDSFFPVVRDLIRSRAEGVLIIANALDTALICQQIRKIDKKIFIFTSEWAFTADVLRQGGGAMEGVIFIDKVDLESRYPRYTEFVRVYKDRYEKLPDFAAIKAYDAVTVLVQAFRTTTDRKGIKGAILNRHIFEGLQGNFAIDQYGDAEIDHFIVIVDNNRFLVLEKL